MRCTFILLFIFILYNSTFGRETLNSSYSYQYLTTREGLSNQRVFSIEKDKDGFIWIATRSGIDCFNGRVIKGYKLFDEEIIADYLGRNIYLTKDNQERIWAYTNSGKIFVYQEETDSFHFEIDLCDKLSSDLFLNQLHIDEYDNFWFAMKDGLFFYNRKQTPTHLLKVISGRNINSIYLSGTRQKMFIAAMEGLYELDISEKGTYKNLRLLLGDNYIQTTFYDEETSLLWVGTFQEGMKVLDMATGEFIRNKYLEQLPHLPYRAIIPLDNHTLLLGIDGAGVYRIDRQTFFNAPFLTDNQEQGGILNGNGVYALYKDETGNLWIGTHTGGVTIATPRNLTFDLIRHEYKNDQSLIDDHVNSITQDKEGDIWYGTNQGVSVYIHKIQKWKHYVTGQVILSLCEDKAGNMWIGGYGTGLYCLDKYRGVIQHFSANMPGTITTDYIYAIHKDPDGGLWIGGVNGNLVNFVPGNSSRKDLFTYYEINLVNSITEMNADTVAIATVNGFYLLNRKTRNFKHYFALPEDAGTKSNTFIYSMHFESPEIVWFGTDGGGLNRFDLNTLQAITYSTENDLPSNYIYGILEDTKKRLWISTDKGIICFDPSTDSNVMNIDLPEEKGENEFNFMSFAKLDNGNFMFGSTSGAVRFNPEQIIYQRYQAPLFFSSFEYSRKKNPVRILKNSLNENSPISLMYNENTFSISFISLSYTKQKDILYSYLLKGFDEEWSEPGYEFSPRYTNVPPGKYTFRVKCSSKEGKYLLDERHLSIKISQPYWNTPIAWVIYSLLVAGIFFLIWRFFAERMEKRQFSEKIQFFINTAHDIRTPVTLILAPLNDLKKEEGLSEHGRNYLNIAHKNTDKLFNLITQLLDFQKIDTTVIPLQVSQYNLIEYLAERVSVFYPLLNSKRIDLQMSLPEDPLYIWLDKDKMDKVLDNLISNAIKYTPENGQIGIRLTQSEKKVFLEIKDNGIGIPKNAQKKIFSNFYRAENAINSKVTGSGIGLLLTRRLIKLHKGNISFQSIEGKGSAFHLTLLKGNAHFPKQSIRIKEGLTEQKIHPEIPIATTGKVNSRETTDKPKLMIVEDNDDLRFYLKKSFEGDYSVIGMENGKAAIDYLQQQPVDLIVSDVMMPGIQGDELCRRIKNDFNTSHIPVILLTARTERSAIITGLESGADDYVIKPFDADILRIKLSNVLNSRKRMREYLLSHSLNKEKTPIQDSIDQLNPLDKEFVSHCISFINSNLSNSEFTVNHLCRELAVSRTLLYEKLKSLTGQAPNDLIRFIRMQEAARLLKEKMPVQEVAERVGYPDAKYFSTAFKKYYGVSPSKFE